MNIILYFFQILLFRSKIAFSKIAYWCVLTMFFGFGLYSIAYSAPPPQSPPTQPSNPPRLTLGPSKITKNEFFTVTIHLQTAIKSYQFPELVGFKKTGLSHSRNKIQSSSGQQVLEESITQNYDPTRTGKLAVPAFVVLVNGNKLQAGPISVLVQNEGDEESQDANTGGYGYDPYEDAHSKDALRKDIDSKEDAFLALKVSKRNIYTGEGFSADLSFYVAENNSVEMEFYDLANQHTQLIQKLKPPYCWETNFNIEAVKGEPTVIKKKKYTKYKIYQSVFYPITKDVINFPSVSLKILLYKGRGRFFGRSSSSIKTFYSPAVRVNVRALPYHRLQDQVPVGVFSLEEHISNHKLNTGQNANYEFRIIAEGNISILSAPAIADDASNYLQIYPPVFKEIINKEDNKVSGQKQFTYKIIGSKAGVYPLNKVFNWVFFNTKTGQYDSLQSTIVLQLSGQPLSKQSSNSNYKDIFYALSDDLPNRLINLDFAQIIGVWVNVGLLLMLVAMILILIVKTRGKS